MIQINHSRVWEKTYFSSPTKLRSAMQMPKMQKLSFEDEIAICRNSSIVIPGDQYCNNSDIESVAMDTKTKHEYPIMNSYSVLNSFCSVVTVFVVVNCLCVCRNIN